MNQESPCTNIQETLARMEKKIHAIDKTINPPFWKKLLRFIWRNLFSIIILIILIVFGYKVWEFLQHLQVQIDAIKSMPTNAVDTAADSVKSVIDFIKFW